MTTQSSIPAEPPVAAAVPPASATSSQTTPAPASSASNASATSAFPSPPIHRGAIDRTTITTAPPARVMHAMRSLLLRMGVRVRAESAFRMRCVRPGADAGAEEEKEKDVENGDGPEEERENDDDLEDEGDWDGDDDDWDGSDDQKAEEEDLEQSDSDSGSGSGSGSGSDTETEATSGTQRLRAGASKSKSKRVPKAKKRIQVHRISQSQILDPPASNANPAPDLRENSEANLNPSSKPKGPYKGRKCTLYGPSPSSDPSHEVRFSVELTQLAGLPGTYSLDIRRLKGHLRSYKFIYDTLRELTTPRSSIAQVPPYQHQLQLPHQRQFQRQFQPQRLQPNDSPATPGPLNPHLTQFQLPLNDVRFDIRHAKTPTDTQCLRESPSSLIQNLASDLTQTLDDP